MVYAKTQTHAAILPNAALRLVHRDAVFGGRCCTCTAASESVTMPLLPLCAWHCVAALRRCRPVAAARSPLSLPPLAI